MRVKSLVVVLAIAISILFTSVVHAQNSLSSGYQITTDHHGVDVFVGETVIAWADTTDLTVASVNFTWKWEETVMRSVINNTWTVWYTSGVPGIPNDTEVHRFTDRYTPMKVGDWSVKAIFYNSFGQTMASEKDSFPTRATSFFAIPEVAIGTIAVIVAMFGALGLFALKRKHVSIKTRL